MVLSELIAALQALPRADKFHIVQTLISELAQQEEPLLKPGQSYPVWSPYDAFDAADKMLKMLETAKTQDHA
jgi:hypothetical protein